VAGQLLVPSMGAVGIAVAYALGGLVKIVVLAIALAPRIPRPDPGRDRA